MNTQPLLTISQLLDKYKNIHKRHSSFGMDPLKEVSLNNDFFIFQNIGKRIGSPVRFGFYALVLCFRAHTKRYINQYEFDVLNN